MISMRYHIVSIAAVFLALALGIVLGATKVSSPILVGAQNENTQLTEQRDQLAQQNADLSKQVASDERFADSVGALAVRATLPKASVVLITTPEADPGDKEAITGLLAGAGAKVTAELDLTANFADPSRSTDLQALLAKSLPAGASVPEVASTGTMAGALLSSVLLTDAQGKPTAKTEEATAALTALSSAGFVTASGALAPGRLVVIVTGGTPSGGSEVDRSTVIADLAAQMKKSAAGVVLAGREGADTETGPIGILRANSSQVNAVSTVDDIESATGRLAAVLALVEQNGGGVGHYGDGVTAQAPAPKLAVG